MSDTLREPALRVERRSPSHPRAAERRPSSETSYYGRPIIKPPVWKQEIGWYLFTGGLAGGSSALCLAARLTGNGKLARRAGLVAAAGYAVSPALLIKDLGRPERFANMLRVFKPTSPMNMGTWLLTAAGSAGGVAAVCDVAGRFRHLRAAGQVTAGLRGPGVATYTGVLIADTAVPVWHEARRHLPVLFATGAAASAGAAAVIVTPHGAAGPARRMMLAGAAGELVVDRLMERSLGPLADPYHTGAAGRNSRLAKAATAGGAVLGLLAGRRRPMLGRVAAGLVLAGAVAERFAVFRAGFQSAEDPRYTVMSQRRPSLL
ncbi:MAG: NrfD/PsrC family molybdoenzyme membrane anchor subunit [Gaiellales bacterium]